MGAAAVAGPVAADPAVGESPSRLRDPQDGWLDLSQFLDTAYGFIPVISPITEPALGYGAMGALIFIDRKPPTASGGFVRPNIAVAGGLATENGTAGLFGAHLGTWQEGRLRTELALADVDANLEFFGLGADPTLEHEGLDYTVAVTGGVAGFNYRTGTRPLWVGLRYSLATTDVSFRNAGSDPPPAVLGDRELRLAGLTPSLTYDSRDNFFTPTGGVYFDLKIPVYREGLGGDRDFELATISGMYFRPLGSSLYFGIRGAAKTSSDGTPFYLRPFVSLRGVQALRAGRGD
jgi:hypothetical protein